MTLSSLQLRRLALPLCLALGLPLASAQNRSASQDGAGASKAPQLGQTQDNLPAGSSMWPAPTAVDWKKPTLIQWMRNYEDAVAVSHETGKPILVCVNMDGETASEHYAGIRYRQPEIVELYAAYVPVIASVYRHNPRDYDDQGQRIPCPRFGTVTCGEHITLEPIVYDKWLKGVRVAPRHIAVELDDTAMYDVYYAWDTASVFNTLYEAVADRPNKLDVRRKDRTLLELVESRDSADREIVEKAFKEGDRELRRTLMRKAVTSGDPVPVDLLRLALFGLDPELQKLARAALSQSSFEGAIDLLLEALRSDMGDAERMALVAALQRIGESSPRARTLATVFEGLTVGEQIVDLDGWTQALEAYETSKVKRELIDVESQLDAHSSAASKRPLDASAQLELAESSLALAVDPRTAVTLASDPSTMSKYSRLMFQDVRRAATTARELGAKGWRVDAALSLAAYYLGEYENSVELAAQAVDGMPAGEHSWNAMAVFAIFAEARRREILRSVRLEEVWDGQLLTDADGAYTVLARHPLGTDAQVVAHHDMLNRIGAMGRATQVLEEGLVRFPNSWPLHARLRESLLKARGVGGFAGLEKVYERMLRDWQDDTAILEWYAGYASLVAAEFHRRAADIDLALDAYGRAIAHYDRSIELEPDNQATADHYAAIAIGARARLSYEQGDLSASLDELLRAFERRPDAAGSLDGLGLSAMSTAQLLEPALRANKKIAQANKLHEAVVALPPKAHELPEFERNSRGRSGPQDAGRQRRRGRQGR